MLLKHVRVGCKLGHNVQRHAIDLARAHQQQHQRGEVDSVIVRTDHAVGVRGVAGYDCTHSLESTSFEW